MNIIDNRNKNLLIWYLLLLLILNIALAIIVDLSHDEAYYWYYSQKLSWGYFDHPPMVAVFIRLGTTLFGDTQFGVRIPFILAQLLSFWWLRPKICEGIKLFIVCTLSFVLMNFAGSFALPDGPMLLFAIWFMKTSEKLSGPDSESIDWVYFALSSSLLMYSKYLGGLVILATLLSNTHFFRRKNFYLAGALSMLLFLPHLYWQFQHEWVSFVFHLTKRSLSANPLLNLIETFAGQAALGGVVLYFWLARKTLFLKNRDVWWWNAWGIFGFVFFLSLRNRIEANWTLTAFAALIVLAHRLKPPTIKLFIPFLVLVVSLRIFILIIPVVALENYAPRICELKGWSESKELYKKKSTEAVWYANEYQLVSKLRFYTDLPVKALHLTSRKSHYSIREPAAILDKNQRINFISFEKMKGAKLFVAGNCTKLYFFENMEVQIILDKLGKKFEEVF